MASPPIHSEWTRFPSQHALVISMPLNFASQCLSRTVLMNYFILWRLTAGHTHVGTSSALGSLFMLVRGGHLFSCSVNHDPRVCC